MTKTAKLVKVPVGADARTYRPGIKAERKTRQQQLQSYFDKMTPEQKAKDDEERRAYDEDMAIWRKEMMSMPVHVASERLSQRRQQRALAKIIDR